MWCVIVFHTTGAMIAQRRAGHGRQEQVSMTGQDIDKGEQERLQDHTDHSRSGRTDLEHGRASPAIKHNERHHTGPQARSDQIRSDCTDLKRGRLGITRHLEQRHLTRAQESTCTECVCKKCVCVRARTHAKPAVSCMRFTFP